MTARFPLIRLGLIVSLLATTLILGVSSARPALAEDFRPMLRTQEFFAALNGEVALPALHKDAELHTPNGTYPGVTGPTDYRSVLETSFSNLHFSVRSVEQSDEFAIASFTMTGINTGSWMGMPHACAGISVPGLAVLRMNLTGTLMVEQWITYDADLITSQIAAYNALDPSSRPGCA